jgi:hypothetical protein
LASNPTNAVQGSPAELKLRCKICNTKSSDQVSAARHAGRLSTKPSRNKQTALFLTGVSDFTAESVVTSRKTSHVQQQTHMQGYEKGSWPEM